MEPRSTPRDHPIPSTHLRISRGFGRTFTRSAWQKGLSRYRTAWLYLGQAGKQAAHYYEERLSRSVSVAEPEPDKSRGARGAGQEPHEFRLARSGSRAEYMTLTLSV